MVKDISTYDILIPAAEKDFIKLRFVYESIVKNLAGFDKIYCVTDVAVPKQMRQVGVEYFVDADVVDFDALAFRGNILARRGWYMQQFIKLFQSITADNYLVVDADVYFNKKVSVIEDGKPSFLLGRNQDHQPYFRLMKKLFGLGKVYPYSFINEAMFFKRAIIEHLLTAVKVNKYGFFELVVNELNKTDEISGFSEYELYGNYVVANFRDDYNYKHLRTYSVGIHRIWHEEEIEKYLQKFKSSDYDMISMHTWI